jgi:hypothetical protein
MRQVVISVFNVTRYNFVVSQGFSLFRSKIVSLVSLYETTTYNYFWYFLVFGTVLATILLVLIETSFLRLFNSVRWYCGTKTLRRSSVPRQPG